MCIYIYVSKYVCIYVSKYICMYEFMYVCMYVILTVESAWVAAVFEQSNDYLG